MYVLRADDGLIQKFAETIPDLLESTIPTRLESDEISSLKTLLANQKATNGWSTPTQQIIIEYLARDEFKMHESRVW